MPGLKGSHPDSGQIRFRLTVFPLVACHEDKLLKLEKFFLDRALVIAEDEEDRDQRDLDLAERLVNRAIELDKKPDINNLELLAEILADRGQRPSRSNLASLNSCRPKSDPSTKRPSKSTRPCSKNNPPLPGRFYS